MTDPIPDTSDQANDSTQPGSAKIMLLGLLLLFATLPMAYLNLSRPGEKSALVGAIFAAILISSLAVLRGRRHGSLSRRRLRCSGLTTLLGCTGFAVALFLYSPWLGHLSGCVLLTGWALLLFPGNRWTEICAWGLLAAASCGVPFLWWGDVERWLIAASGWTSSLMLDAYAVPHLAVGNRFELVSRILSLTDLYGAFVSLWNLWIIVGGLAILSHRSLWTFAKTATLCPVWLLLAYMLCLLGVTAGLETGSRDLSSGMDLTLLQALTLFVAAFLSWLCMLVFHQLSAPVMVDEDKVGPILAPMNRLLRWPQAEDSLEPTEYLQPGPAMQAPPQAILQTINIQWMAAAVACVLALVPAWLIADGRTRTSPPPLNTNLTEGVMQIEFPESAGEFKRIGQLRTLEIPGSTVAHQNISYKSSTRSAELHVSHPYQGWYDSVPNERNAGNTLIGQATAGLETNWP